MSYKRRRVEKKRTLEDTMESSLAPAEIVVDDATSTKGQSLNSMLVEDIKDGVLFYKVLFDNKILSIMPKFSGNIVDYHAFKFDYKAIVLDSNLPEYHKVKVLKNCLKDVLELEFIQYKPNDSSTIEKAFEFMDKIYMAEFNNLFEETLREHKRVKEYNFEDLRSLHSAFIKTVAICKNFGLLDDYRYRIYKAVMYKLPRDIEEEILEKRTENYKPGLEDIEKVLEHSLGIYKEILETESFRKRDYDEGFDDLSVSSSSSIANVPICKFDGQRHLYSDCKLSHQRRMQIVHERQLCRSCLGEWHFAIECKFPHTCHKCNRRHHIYLCPDIPINSSP